MLVQHFGPHYGRWLVQAANGEDERPVVMESEPRSISRETTFERDLDPRRDRHALSEILVSLCEGVSEDLRHKGYLGRTIGVKLRYDDFRTVTRAKTLATPVDDMSAILGGARDCLKRVALDRKLRLLGVRASSLSRPGAGAEVVPASTPMVSENLRLFD